MTKPHCPHCKFEGDWGEGYTFGILTPDQVPLPVRHD